MIKDGIQYLPVLDLKFTLEYDIENKKYRSLGVSANVMIEGSHDLIHTFMMTYQQAFIDKLIENYPECVGTCLMLTNEDF